MIYVGIDLGYTGGFAWTSPGGVVYGQPMPTIGTSKARDFDLFRINQALSTLFNPKAAQYHFVMECAEGWNNPTTARVLARNGAIIEAMLAVAGRPLRLVKVAQWQKVMFAGTDSDMKPKVRAAAVMRREFPDAVEQLPASLWDAYLISQFAARA